MYTVNPSPSVKFSGEYHFTPNSPIVQMVATHRLQKIQQRYPKLGVQLDSQVTITKQVTPIALNRPQQTWNRLPVARQCQFPTSQVKITNIEPTLRVALPDRYDGRIEALTNDTCLEESRVRLGDYNPLKQMGDK
jgi:hypothetical protein